MADYSKHPDIFNHRHIGPNDSQIQSMLKTIEYNSLNDLIDTTIPPSIRFNQPIPESFNEGSKSEFETLKELESLGSHNKIFRSYIGIGYNDCITPPVIQRNILENPGWYTQYTPYQAEISQGRLEALLNFQTMVMDLTGMGFANASLLDESTAASEAMTMAYNLTNHSNTLLISNRCHPQTINVVKTRADPLGIEVKVIDHNNISQISDFFGIILQYPCTEGSVEDYSQISKIAHDNNALVIVCADILSLTLLTPPSDFGADVVVGNTQRFGMPLGFGGPHAAFFATHDKYKRQTPGRVVGVSKDSNGNTALRLALQTREQHIRRDKATSNICTAQVLPAIVASMYAVYHGPQRLKQIAAYVNNLTISLAAKLSSIGYTLSHSHFFDTICIKTKNPSQIISRAIEKEVNLRVLSDDSITISLDEKTTEEEVLELFDIFNLDEVSISNEDNSNSFTLAKNLHRNTSYLENQVFNSYHSETELLRYIFKLQNRDLSLTSSMIPLGSCTMKLNSTTEMMPITWKCFSDIHPFSPSEQTEGYQTLISSLGNWLVDLTGLDEISFQPNAGSQGEYAGLLAIRNYHISKNESNRNVCLIPISAHGTNPASAIMAGMKVVPVSCDDQGNIDISDLTDKIEEHSTNLAGIMITYPSTHGVFEESIVSVCNLIHSSGGLVYMDGANFNAMAGVCRPGDLGVDVCHLNLHKTFCIPHGGGGPGMGPIVVQKDLIPFLPGDSLNGSGAISSSSLSSALILTIPWAYISMMGWNGLTKATKIAILNANYIAHRLKNDYPILFTGNKGLVAHECILDIRDITENTGVTVEDIAKRLIDYGFHAPTMSWPVSGTLMIEPTESESKKELDSFCDTLLLIRKEIENIENKKIDVSESPLRNSPHTAKQIASENWAYQYTRETAAFPMPDSYNNKFWPHVGRVDNVHGDRNLICSCNTMEDYLE